jgi:hypothetical protein
MATREQVGPSMRHDNSVMGAVFSKDESRILSWSDDGTLRQWDAATLKQVAPSMRHDGSIYGAIMSKDERRVWSWSEDSSIRSWNIEWPSGNLLEMACSVLGQDHDLTQVSRYYGVEIVQPICAYGTTPAKVDWTKIERSAED